jgi:hypothetical protein
VKCRWLVREGRETEQFAEAMLHEEQAHNDPHDAEDARLPFRYEPLGI